MKDKNLEKLKEVNKKTEKLLEEDRKKGNYYDSDDFREEINQEILDNNLN